MVLLVFTAKRENILSFFVIRGKVAFKYYGNAFGGVGSLRQNSDTTDALEGGGGLSQNAGMLTL